LRQPQGSFSWWRTQNAAIRAGFVLPFKKAQCFAPGWFYAGEMFDFFLETRPQSLSLSETYALKYWWCSPPRTGIASVRPTV
jgi:hypothetical protein